MIELYNIVEEVPRMSHLITEDEAERMANYLKRHIDRIDKSVKEIWYTNPSNRIYFEGIYKSVYYYLVYEVDNSNAHLDISNIKQGTYVIEEKENLIPRIKEGIDAIKTLIDTGRYM